MTQDIDQNFSAESVTRYTPGHPLAPFGWAADALGAMVEAEPTLLFHLFELDRARMHLVLPDGIPPRHVPMAFLSWILA